MPSGVQSIGLVERVLHLKKVALLADLPAADLTVVAGQATAADALSTAFALMNEEGIKSILSRSGDAQSYITTESGTRAITAANEGPI